MKTKGMRLLGLVLSIVMMATMTTFAVAEGTPQRGGTLVIAYASEPDTMNVYSTHMLADVQTCIVQGLIIPDGNMNYVPVLCKEVPTLENGLIELSEDGATMTITYNLKEGVKWHDGEPFTSADVKFTWEAVSNPDFIAEGKEGCDDIDRIETPDDYTVVCYYNKPVADFASTLFTFGILPKHMLEGEDMNLQTGYNREGVIGTGPYKMVQWVEGEYIELARNEDYYEDGAWLDGIIFKFVPDYNTQLTQLKTGEVQFAMGLPSDMYADVQAVDGVVADATVRNAWCHIDFNFRNDILGQDLAVRQAINYCVDKEGIVNNLLGGLPVVADSSWMYFDQFHNPNLPAHEYSLEKAAQVLEDAGWTLNASGVREKDGATLEFEWLGRTTNADEIKIQQVVADACKEIGIVLTINNMAQSAMNDLRMSGDYDMKIGGWITGTPSRTRFYGNQAFAPDSVNDIFYDNQELSDLLAESDTVLDVELRKEMLYRAQEMMIEDMVTIPTHTLVQIVAHTENLKGFVPNPTNMTHFWAVADWYLEQ
ncbi:peptide ABC transporter substrate-binding protein [Eubacteriales bacterium OttesenSCG-928-A19]|nr:peptide ABC transporter substrate-binding protein [Eubacteriales bacterium OttesenSCG-928-A19]